MYFCLSFSLLLISISMNESEANVDNNNNKDNNDIKRPNYRLINDLLLSSNNEYPRQESHYLRPYLTPYDNNPRLHTIDGNNHNSIAGSSNFATKRVIPIGGYPPNNMWNTGFGQNGFGFNGAINSPYNQFFSNPMNPMASHLMPQTFNFMNTLRAGLKTGIPSYGFGFGLINDGFFAPNNGLPFNTPIRSSFSDQNNDEKLSFPQTSDSTQKISQRKN